MLKISRITVAHQQDGCITDTRPGIGFALESDVPGEGLDHAVISCGDWEMTTHDQINNSFGGEMRPFTDYRVHIRAVGTSGETAEGDATFSTGRMDTPWTGKWITDSTYRFPKKDLSRAHGFPEGLRGSERNPKSMDPCHRIGHL